MGYVGKDRLGFLALFAPVGLTDVAHALGGVPVVIDGDEKDRLAFPLPAGPANHSLARVARTASRRLMGSGGGGLPQMHLHIGQQ